MYLPQHRVILITTIITMPVSLEDLMEFMQKEKAERALEREADKKELMTMISLGVKKEVEASIEPVKEKQAVLEKEQDEIKRQFSDVLSEMKDIKLQLQTTSSGSVPCLPLAKDVQVHGAGYGSAPLVQPTQCEEDQGGDQQARIRKVISMARRTLGLHRIDDSGDLFRMRQVQFGGAKTEAEDRELAVKEFLKCELKMSQETIDTMEMEEIFAPARTDPECLYVTFKHGSSVARIFEKTRVMRKEARILNYIPAEFQERYFDIREIEYSLRQEQNCHTRIKMGLNDLELSKKMRGSRRWERVTLPSGLAAVDLSKAGWTRNSVAASMPESPAPGRPGQDRDRPNKRGRESPGTPPGQSDLKAAREELQAFEENCAKDREEAWKQTIEQADLVGDSRITPTKENEGLRRRPDTGIVTSISGTPPQFHHKSPILHKTSRIPSLKF